jgi:diphthamide synthase subunit DPH2
MKAWAPDCDYFVFPNRFEILSESKNKRRFFRSKYAIPSDALLVARSSRIIPAKCIERELRLLRSLQDKLEASGDTRRIYLFVTGPIDEDPAEFQRLRIVEDSLVSCP